MSKTERSRFLRFLADLRVISATDLAVRRAADMLQQLRRFPVTVDDVASGIEAAEKLLKDAVQAFCYGREATDDDAFPLDAVEAVRDGANEASAMASGLQAHLNNAARASPHLDDKLIGTSHASDNAARTVRYAHNLLQNPVSPALVMALADCLRMASLATLSATNLMRELLRRPQKAVADEGVPDGDIG